MITFRELFAFSTTEPKEVPVKDFEAAVRELIDSYKGGKMDRGEAVAALRLQADLLARDETWNPETADEGETEAAAAGQEAKAEAPPVELEEEAEDDYPSGKSGKKKK